MTPSPTPPPPTDVSNGAPILPPAPPAPQPPRRPAWPAVVIAALVVLGLAGVAAAVLVAVGGKPDDVDPRARVEPAAAAKRAAALPDARDLLGVYQSAEVTAAIPATWARGKGSTDARLLLVDPDAPGVRMVIAHAPARTDLAARARSEQRRVAGDPKLTEITFPGGRGAWRLEAGADDGGRQVSYLFDECKRAVTVTGIAPDSTFDSLRRRFGLVASLTHVNC
jgi:hypothetical protein